MTGILARGRRWQIAALLAGMVLVYALATTIPHATRRPLVETVTWSVVVFAAFVGWGSLVARLVAPDERIDLGLRASWGASAIALIGGTLMVPSWMGRTSALLLVEIGALITLVTLFLERARFGRRLASYWRVGRRDPKLAAFTITVVGILAFHCLAGIVEWHTDPYDDDIAYLAFVRKLLATGSFPEPFSFRRLSALGGQTMFAALVALRVGPSQAHTFDRGICLAIATLLILGYRERGRRPPAVVVLATALMVPTLPVLARNTAANYSAIAFFLALFRTTVWAGARERAALRASLPIALVSATVCTLRQNYVPVVGVFVVTTYAFAATRPASWAARLREPVSTALLTIGALVPWFVCAWQSNRTFLYPLTAGTFNPALSFNQDGGTLGDEARAFATTLLEGLPLPTLGVFVVAAVLLRERAERRPMLSFSLATLVGFALLVHSINQGDPANLGRYMWGFVCPFAVVTVLASTVGWRPALRDVDARERVAGGLAFAAVLFQLVHAAAAGGLTKFYVRAIRNTEGLASEVGNTGATAPFALRHYTEMQAAVPTGARIAVQLDEPHWLDFGRNPIWNLDMPGYSSLPPSMPYFRGSQAVEDYLRGQGVRYVAFVRPTHSRYQYRRDYWLKMLVEEMAIWRTFAPYVLDFTDNLVELSERHRRLFDADGDVVVDLEARP